MRELWQQWLDDWRGIAATAARHGWAVEGPVLAKPATARQINAVEQRHGLAVPPQLKAVLTEFARKVAFSWSIPRHLHPHGRFEGLWNGGIRDVIWDIEALEYAFNNFNNWREDLGSPDAHEGEEPNSPDMWENQFPFAVGMNGDMLTIDVTHASGERQPVRYFSHELEGLHAHALAPSFEAFITAYTKLGCVGSTHDSWFGFLDKGEPGSRISYLSADTPGAREWLAWLAADHRHKADDEPPTPVPAKSAADRALLKSAKANDEKGVRRALLAGADPDCYDPEDDGFREFSTAISDAVGHDNIALVDLLLSHGALLDTRRLPLAVAAQYSTPATVEALIARGARANGWRGDRYTPLHTVFTQREHFNEMRATGQADKIGRIVMPTDFSAFENLDPEAPGYMDKLQDLTASMFKHGPDTRTAEDLARQRQDLLAVLDALLTAGADANAPWDNGITMLMWSDDEAMGRLLAHGADPNRRNHAGETAVHWGQRPSVEKVKLLLAHGGEVNALSTPPVDDSSALPAHTPLQAHLSRDHCDIVEALLAAGADPLIRDGAGRSTLFYCRSRAALEPMMARGLDVKERGGDGETLIHRCVAYSGGELAKSPQRVALLAFLVDQGVDINAQDDTGRTALHNLADYASEYRDMVADAKVLLDLGARRDIRDNDGKRPMDVARRKAKDLRALLK